MCSAETMHRLALVARSTSVAACSVLGSFLAQEVLKAVSLSGDPAFNVVVFSEAEFVVKAFPVC